MTITLDTARVLVANIEFISTKEASLNDAHIALATRINAGGLDTALPYIGKLVSVATAMAYLGGGDMTALSMDPEAAAVMSVNNVLDEVMEQLDFVVYSASSFAVTNPRPLVIAMIDTAVATMTQAVLFEGQDAVNAGTDFVTAIQEAAPHFA